jgi:CheY-like chemotaxis protein
MKKILYLDPDSTNGLLFKTIAKNYFPFDSEITILTRTVLAEPLLITNNFDLIISETHSIDGMHLIRNIREGCYGDKNKLVPAIALDSVGIMGGKEKCFNVGFNAYILVPSGKHVLIDEVKKILL